MGLYFVIMAEKHSEWKQNNFEGIFTRKYYFLVALFFYAVKITANM